LATKQPLMTYSVLPPGARKSSSAPPMFILRQMAPGNSLSKSRRLFEITYRAMTNNPVTLVSIATTRACLRGAMITTRHVMLRNESAEETRQHRSHVTEAEIARRWISVSVKLEGRQRDSLDRCFL
jgi:hypothetical protein